MSDERMAPSGSHEFADWWRDRGGQELRQLLYWAWDPLDLNEEFPNAADEYDGYALEIATALASGLSVSTLAALLGTIERDRMGMNRRQTDAIASRLHAWYERSRETTQVPSLSAPATSASARSATR